MSNFELLNQDSQSKARIAVLTTAHGKVRTPTFMPIGTVGAVKGITPLQLKQTGANIVLANIYHLMLRPGVDTIEKLGGLHKFMAWQDPILTDSGGYQIFSLSRLTKIDDEGVEFVSHVDGAKLQLNAEITTQIQNRLGADIIMCLDQCAAFDCEKPKLKRIVERTIRWATVCKQVHRNDKQLLFGITQGGVDRELRTYCTSELVKLNFDGYAIGGLSVGEGHENMIKTVEISTELLPEGRPRYLMGVGTPIDIIAAVKAGIDMFDCVIPTRNGRNAYAFTEQGPLRLRNSIHSENNQPIEAGCNCYCCSNFTRAAIRHFFNVGEMLGPILTSLHNLRFYQRLMNQIKQALEKGRFADWQEEKMAKYKSFYGQNAEKLSD